MVFPWDIIGLLMISSDNLTYSNLITSGHCAATDPRDHDLNGNLVPTANVRELASPLGSSGTVVYFSILLRPLAPIGSSSTSSYYGLVIGNLCLATLSLSARRKRETTMAWRKGRWGRSLWRFRRLCRLAGAGPTEHDRISRLTRYFQR